MNTKKKNRSYIIWIAIWVVACVIIVICELNKKLAKKEILKEDALDMEITKTHYDHGALSFNDSVYIVSACFLDESIGLRAINDLSFPYYVKKKANNDTLRVITKDKEYILIYRN